MRPSVLKPLQRKTSRGADHGNTLYSATDHCDRRRCLVVGVIIGAMWVLHIGGVTLPRSKE